VPTAIGSIESTPVAGLDVHAIEAFEKLLIFQVATGQIGGCREAVEILDVERTDLIRTPERVVGVAPGPTPVTLPATFTMIHLNARPGATHVPHLSVVSHTIRIASLHPVAEAHLNRDGGNYSSPTRVVSPKRPGRPTRYGRLPWTRTLSDPAFEHCSSHSLSCS
jgi:hypothetical protein